MNSFLNRYHNWHYKNSAFLIISILLLIYFADSDMVRATINMIGNLGYFGAFIVGIFFVSIFTVAPSIIVLYDLAEKLNPFLIAIIAGAGAVFGDLLIFRFFKDRIFEELSPLFSKFSWLNFLKNLFRTPYFSWILPLVGAVIIASPFPDEVGITIMGLCKIKIWQFIIVSFFLNAIGILIIILLARLT